MSQMNLLVFAWYLFLCLLVHKYWYQCSTGIISKTEFFFAPSIILINKTINALECDLSQYSQNITVLQSSYDYRALQFLNPNKELKTLSTVSFFAFKLAKAAMTSMLVNEYSAAFSKPF